ncbi:MAG TPA: phosphopantetheine-binding protein [Planctomycetota bacterium]
MLDEAAFFRELAGVLEVPASEVTANYAIEPEGWDSLVVLSVLALVDTHLDAAVDAAQIKACSTAGDILALVKKASP